MVRGRHGGVRPVKTACSRSAASLVLAFLLGMVAACHADGTRKNDANVQRTGVDALCLCDGRPFCEDFDLWGRSSLPGAHLALDDCARDKTASLYGDWPLTDADSHTFYWEADVRPGGVFPVPGYTAVSLSCFDEHRQVHSPDIGLRFDPDGFDWAKLTADDVFIPLRGKASVDDVSVATATLDAVDGDRDPRLTVSITEADASTAAHGGLEPGDAFPWGGYRARVVRIVAPQAATLGAIGWVEVHLSEEAALRRL